MKTKEGHGLILKKETCDFSALASICLLSALVSFGEGGSLRTGRKHFRYKIEWERIKEKHDRLQFYGVSEGGVSSSLPAGCTIWNDWATLPGLIWETGM